ncbi:MAG TPA: hypothetical protein VMR70_18575 [Flavisolibacter sp.]|nr:hypothetical protein [Flavisolibacter sp.]
MSDDTSRDLMLELTTRFAQQNKEFTEAMKEKRPVDQLQVLHSEMQEIYNHIVLLKQAKSL